HTRSYGDWSSDVCSSDLATIKGLTTFGDRRQGTDRNRAAADWIEAQLKSYGCSNVARLKYDYQPPTPPSPAGRGGQAARTSAARSDERRVGKEWRSRGGA